MDNVKNDHPTFAIKLLTPAEEDYYVAKYNDEPLFRLMKKVLTKRWQMDDYRFKFTELWYNAKDIFSKLLYTPHPETYIDYIIERYERDLDHIGAPLPQAIMSCVYCMMLTVEKSDHFKTAIDDFQDRIQKRENYPLLCGTAALINIGINTHSEPFIAYDYAKELLSGDEICDENKKQESAHGKLSKSTYETKKLNFINNDVRIKELEDEVERLRNDNDGYSEQKGMSASKWALLFTTIYYHIGGLPANGRQSLSTVLQQVCGYSEKTAQKALGYAPKKEDIEVLEKIFQPTSPLLAKHIKEIPDKLAEKERERLRKMSENQKLKNKKHIPL